MRKPNRKFLNIMVAIAFAATLFGAANSRILANPSHASRKTLVTDYNVGGSDWAQTLDPAITAYVNDGAMEAMMYDNLIKLEPTHGNPVPDLATHWKVSGGGKVYTFYLRRNARFSNGHHVFARDVVYTLNRAAHAPTAQNEAATYDNLIKGINPNGATAGNVSGIKALNKWTVQITITKPAAYFLKALAYPTLYVVDPAVIAGKGYDAQTNECKLSVGSGPFKPVCANGSSDKTSYYGGGSPQIRMVPNPYFFGKKPTYNARNPYIANSDTAWTAYKAGNLSMGVFSPPTEFNTASHLPGFHAYNTSVVRWTNFNLTAKPFNNKNCRAAVVYAYNRVGFANLFPHTSIPWYEMVAKGMLGDFGNKGVPHYNLKLAKKYAKKCGAALKNLSYPIPKMLTRTARVSTQYSVQMYAKAGITVHPYEVSRSEYNQLRNTYMTKSHITMIGQAWQADYFDPQDYVSLLWSPSSIYNIGRFKNATFDSLIKKADVNGNQRSRAQQYIKAQKILFNTFSARMNSTDPGYENINPRVTGLYCGAAYGYCAPLGMNWANVHVR